jgi:radical SAM superfamily enzyme YgiQ (UPF0313 family)
MNRCSYCSYNNYVIGWKKREISDLVSDIHKLNKMFGLTKFALFDNNFGSTIKETEERSIFLEEAIKRVNFDLTLSLNISLENLTENILGRFKQASIKVLLVGLESFNKRTLEKIYLKKQNIQHSLDMLKYAEEIGINVVVSYILFHPWLTFESLKNEIYMIEKLGRYKIPQFIANSKLKIVPGTLIEKAVEEAGLIIKENFLRDFKFKNARVKSIYDKIQYFYLRNIKNVLKPSNVWQLKINEWKYIKSLLKNER